MYQNCVPTFALQLFLCQFSFSRPFFLAGGLVGAVFLGSFQARAISIPAAPDEQGTRPRPSHCPPRCGRGRPWRRGEGRLGQHIAREKLVSVYDGTRDVVIFQQACRVSSHSCMMGHGIGERSFESGWDGSGLRLGQQP